MTSQKIVIRASFLLLLPFLLISGVLDPVSAQKSSNDADDKQVVEELSPELVGKQANELLSSINDTAERLGRYEDLMAKASKEDKLVLELQIYKLQKKVMNDVHSLADALLELEKTEQQPKLREEVEDLFMTTIPRFWVQIGRLRAEIDKARAGRLEVAPEDRAAIEDEVNKCTERLNVLYEVSLAHIQKMELLGLDVREAKENFTRLLKERAQELSGRMELALVRIDELEVRRKETPDDTSIVLPLNATVRSLDNNISSLEIILNLMEKIDLDTAGYREQLMTTTMDFSVGLMDTGAAVGLMGRTINNIKDWLVVEGPKYLVKFIIFVVIIILFRFAAKLVRVGLEKALESTKLNLAQLARRMIVSTISNIVMLFGILVALSQLGISLGPLLAGLGVAGFIVGFALQDTLGNFASGVMILIYRPYDMGDLIDVGGVFGKVNKMTLVSTSLLTLDNQTIVVPNSKIWGDVIKNVTDQDIRRIDMVFGISYSDDIPKTEAVLADILKSNERILDDPEPVVHLHTLNDSSVDFVVRPWVKVDDYWDVYWDVTRAVKMRFDEEGISIPFPQRDVHVYNENSQTMCPDD